MNAQPYMEQHIAFLLDSREFRAFLNRGLKQLVYQANDFLPDENHRMMFHNFRVSISDVGENGQKGLWTYSYFDHVSDPKTMEDVRSTSALTVVIHDKALIEKIEAYWDAFSEE